MCESEHGGMYYSTVILFLYHRGKPLALIEPVKLKGGGGGTGLFMVRACVFRGDYRTILRAEMTTHSL